jgi:DNA-binding MurR/RpiR family transcriptional regulator
VTSSPHPSIPAGDPLEKRILDVFPRLTRKQQGVARVLLDDRLLVAFSSAGDLGSRAGVDAATVVRFAQLLGYSGWVGLRQAVRDQVPRLATAADRISRTIDASSPAGEHHAEVVEQDLRNIRETAILNSDDTIDAAVRALTEARQVFVIGLGLEMCVADILALQLQRSGLQVRRVSTSLARSALDLAPADSGDVVVGLAVWRYVADSVRMFEQACGLGARGIALTDSMVSPIARTAELVLLAADAAPRLSHSLTGMLSLVNVLANGVTVAAPERSVERLRRIDAMFDAMRTIDD